MLPGTHLALAFPVVLAAKLPIPLSLGFLLGSVLPDKLDFFFSGGNFRTWSKIHRTVTHTWWLLLIILIASLFIRTHSDMGDMLVACMRGVFIGMLYHVFWDAFTPSGIPFLKPFGRKYGLGLIPSRGFRATMLCSVCVLLSLWLAYVQFFSESQYLDFASDFVDRLGQAFPKVKELFAKAAGISGEAVE